MTESLVNPQSAAEWFLAIYSTEDPSPEIVQAWLRWLDASDENRQAFEEIVDIWHRTPAAVIANPVGDPRDAEYDGSVPVAQWRATRSGIPHESDVIAMPRRRRASYWAGLAAAAAVAGFAVALTFMLSPNEISSGEFATRTAQHRNLMLADGSKVILGAESKLAVNLTATARELVLEAGEAYFSVAKDPSRPFVVRALNGEITAVGTEFNVRALEGRVTVTVTEGSVKVSDATGSASAGTPESPAPIQLAQGQQVTFEVHQPMPVAVAAKLEEVSIDESARWRDGWLVYRNEPLRYVVADISRYTSERIELDASAANIHFSGAVFKSDIEEWIEALSTVAPVDVTRHGAGVVISAR